MNTFVAYTMIIARFLMVIAPRPVALKIGQMREDYINPRWTAAIAAQNEPQYIFWHIQWMDAREDHSAVEAGHITLNWRNTKR